MGFGISFGPRSVVSRLLLGTAFSGLAMGAALAQDAGGGNQIESVVVTGTAIRGAAPTGLSLITVDANTIAQQDAVSTSALVLSVPAITGFGQSAQGSAATPTIHNLGDTASTATLVLIDGHRIQNAGPVSYGPDPSTVPTAAIERVEVLPDGASAIYGADAVAGVVNIITKKNFDGWETDVRDGQGDDYNTSYFSTTFGKQWTGGGVVAVYSYTDESQLACSARSFCNARQDLLQGPLPASDVANLPAEPAGIPASQPYPSLGTNFANFACAPATIANGGGTAHSVGNAAYYYPYNNGAASVPVSTNPSAGTCTTQNTLDLLPSEVRNQGYFSIHQAISDRITLTADADYSSRMNSRATSRGTIQAIAYGPGATTANSGAVAGQINPFYQGNAGTTNIDELVRYDFDGLLGPGATSKAGQTDIFSDIGMTVDLGGDWAMTTLATFGQDNSWTRTFGTVNPAAAYLAINGTANTAGTQVTSIGTSAVADPNGLGTIQSATRVLTAANALDVWNPAATNNTSPAVIQSLLDSQSNTESQHNDRDFNLKFDGPLMDDWAGSIKVAAGGEFRQITYTIRNTLPQVLGDASTDSQFKYIPLHRTSYSAFLEVDVPLVKPSMDIPLVQSFSMDFAARYDSYSDVGSTHNPKVGFDWSVVDGLKARGSYGTSFTAPSLASIGQPGTGLTSELDIYNGSANSLAFATSVTVPFNYRNLAGTFLATPATCVANGGTLGSVVNQGVTQPGCTINTTASGNYGINSSTGGNPQIKPETATSYSFGLDGDFGQWWEPLQGLIGSLTYYQATLFNVITTQGRNYTSSLINPGFQDIVTFAPPGGWTAASPFIQNFIKGIPLASALPTTIWYAINGVQQNLYDIWTNGLDFDFGYRFDTTDMGSFTASASGNEILRMSEAVIDPFSPGGTDNVIDIKDGNNSGRYTGNELKGRLTLGWNLDPYSATVAFNYVHPINQVTASFPYNLYILGQKGAGYEHVSAVETFDLHLGYNIPASWVPGSQVYLNVTNIFDQAPPYFDSANGFNSGANAVSGDPTGRVLTVGIRSKF